MKEHAEASKAARHARSKFPLIRLFRVVPWKIVFALAGPVTPEVAGSSPVAPV
jgi:hypothetical protein